MGLGTSNNLLKRIFRRSADILYGTPFLDRLLADRLRGQAVCLCYHRVDEASELDYLGRSGLPVTTPESLRKDVRTLKRWGFKFVTFREWQKAGELDPDRPNVILTFDDGYQDQYSKARAVLDEEAVKGVFFQSTALVESQELIWAHKVFAYCRDSGRYAQLLELCRKYAPEHVDRAQAKGQTLAYYLIEEMPSELSQRLEEETRRLFSPEAERRLAKRLHPSRAQLQDALKAGHEIGCHGHKHLKRSTVSPVEFEQDLLTSIECLRNWMGERPVSYAFPFGSYFAQDLSVVSAHFSYVTTVKPGVISDRTDKLQLPRYYHREPSKNQRRRQRWLLTGF